MGTVSGVGIAEILSGVLHEEPRAGHVLPAPPWMWGQLQHPGVGVPKALGPLWPLGIWDETVCSRCWGSQPTKAQQSWLLAFLLTSLQCSWPRVQQNLLFSQ